MSVEFLGYNPVTFLRGYTMIHGRRRAAETSMRSQIPDWIRSNNPEIRVFLLQSLFPRLQFPHLIIVRD